jgi:hypothetical protein
MMKTILMATAAVVAMTTFASAADRPTIIGYTEYSVEAETYEVGLGTEFIVGDMLLISPKMVSFGTSEDFTFDHAEVKASYGVNGNVDVYAKVTTDADFNYAETTVGVSFQF